MTFFWEQLSQMDSQVLLAKQEAFFLLGNSVAVGFTLSLVTFLTSRHLKQNMLGGKDGENPTTQLLAATNQLFLCVGLAGTMLLVNENLVRTVAIMAAFSLLRFRVKIDGKGLGASLIFSIMAGMACGLNELAIAWVVSGIYVLLILIFLATDKLLGVQSKPLQDFTSLQDSNQKSDFNFGSH